MECHRKVANVSKLEKAERYPKNEIQPASESDIESEVSEPAAKYIRVSQRCRSQEKQDDLSQGTVIGSSRCSRNILPAKCIICKKSTAWGKCKTTLKTTLLPLRKADEDLLVHIRDLDCSVIECLYKWFNNKRRILDMNISEQLSEAWCDVILGFHWFTGSDSTSSFTGKGKATCLKVARSKVEYVRAFQDLGKQMTVDQAKGTMSYLQKFVCHLYGQENEIDMWIMLDITFLEWEIALKKHCHQLQTA
ncbi:Hypothetical predicted protein [Paramuricea clavata]|uniref:Uncharacterized protein n=1 Tax=Paramuricea clavata TaxID=317549 RepID=A0A6S7JFR1_PARCT|nr:Hypothetical predicted protein [Paramuricea clavata]